MHNSLTFVYVLLSKHLFPTLYAWRHEDFSLHTFNFSIILHFKIFYCICLCWNEDGITDSLCLLKLKCFGKYAKKEKLVHRVFHALGNLAMTEVLAKIKIALTQRGRWMKILHSLWLQSARKWRLPCWRLQIKISNLAFDIHNTKGSVDLNVL